MYHFVKTLILFPIIDFFKKKKKFVTFRFENKTNSVRPCLFVVNTSPRGKFSCKSGFFPFEKKWKIFKNSIKKTFEWKRLWLNSNKFFFKKISKIFFQKFRFTCKYNLSSGARRPFLVPILNPIPFWKKNVFFKKKFKICPKTYQKHHWKQFLVSNFLSFVEHKNALLKKTKINLNFSFFSLSLQFK